jgi:hypothetical protein
MDVKYTNWPLNILISSIPRPCKIYSNWGFGFENIHVGKEQLKIEAVSVTTNLVRAISICDADATDRASSLLLRIANPTIMRYNVRKINN